MNTTPNRPLHVLGTFAFVVLAVSTAGAIFALHPNGPKLVQPVPAPPAPEPVRYAPVVVYGFVDLEPGVMPLYPLQPGRVVEVLVRENESVKKDKPILRLDDRLARARLAEAKADLADAEAQLVLAQKLPEQYKLKSDQQKAANTPLAPKIARQAERHDAGVGEDVARARDELDHGEEPARVDQDGYQHEHEDDARRQEGAGHDPRDDAEKQEPREEDPERRPLLERVPALVEAQRLKDPQGEPQKHVDDPEREGQEEKTGEVVGPMKEERPQPVAVN